MMAIVTLLVVVTVSVLVTRIATIALTHTGLSNEAARFQARSAFSGAGFTTTESERVVQHPVRRRIIMLLMLLGNAGIVTAVSTLILSFVGPTRSGSLVVKIVLLAAGLAAIWGVAMSPWVDRRLSRWIDRALKRYSKLDVTDHVSLMRLVGDYRVAELGVREGDWVAGKTLAETELRAEGLLVLGVQRADGAYIGTPEGDTVLEPDDTVVLYGRIAALERLDRRRDDRAAEWDHLRAAREQARVREEEQTRATPDSRPPES
jgi:hypothetical protein